MRENRGKKCWKSETRPNELTAAWSHNTDGKSHTITDLCYSQIASKMRRKSRENLEMRVEAVMLTHFHHKWETRKTKNSFFLSRSQWKILKTEKCPLVNVNSSLVSVQHVDFTKNSGFFFSKWQWHDHEMLENFLRLSTRWRLKTLRFHLDAEFTWTEFWSHKSLSMSHQSTF